MELSPDNIREIFNYKDGLLFWKIRPSHNVQIGDIAGSIGQKNKKPRRVVAYKNKDYLVARLIFCYHKGYFPKGVDHEDRNPLNDKIENLRECDQSQNIANSSSRKNSTSKYLGVHYYNRDRVWIASITKNGNHIVIGRYDIEQKAALAYNRAAVLYHKEFANLNIINKNS
jgi:hypothetical protein